MRRALVACWLIGAAATARAENVQQHHIRQHIELRKRMQLKQHRLLERSMFLFTAPDGWKGAPTKDDDDAAWKAWSDPDAANPAMVASIGEGAVKLDNEFLAAQAKLFGDFFRAMHPTGSIKVVKKDLVKVDGGEAARVIFETRADGEKTTKPQREVDCVTTNEGHNANIHYVVPAANWSKVEKKLDESLRKTRVVPPTQRVPAPLHPPEAQDP